MSCFVYVLVNGAGRLYIGLTENVARRLAEHNAGNITSTKGHRPYRLLRVEAFRTKVEARRREVLLKKSGRLRQVLKEQSAAGTVPFSTPLSSRPV